MIQPMPCMEPRRGAVTSAARVVGTVVAGEITALPEKTDDPAYALHGTTSRRCDFCGATVPDPDPRLSGGGSGTAPADPALRAAAQAPAARGTGAAGLAVGDRPAVAGGGDPGAAHSLHLNRRLQARAGTEA